MSLQGTNDYVCGCHVSDKRGEGPCSHLPMLFLPLLRTRCDEILRAGYGQDLQDLRLNNGVVKLNRLRPPPDLGNNGPRVSLIIVHLKKYSKIETFSHCENDLMDILSQYLERNFILPSLTNEKPIGKPYCSCIYRTSESRKLVYHRMLVDVVRTVFNSLVNDISLGALDSDCQTLSLVGGLELIEGSAWLARRGTRALEGTHSHEHGARAALPTDMQPRPPQQPGTVMIRPPGGPTTATTRFMIDRQNPPIRQPLLIAPKETRTSVTEATKEQRLIQVPLHPSEDEPNRGMKSRAAHGKGVLMSGVELPARRDDGVLPEQSRALAHPTIMCGNPRHLPPTPSYPTPVIHCGLPHPVPSVTTTAYPTQQQQRPRPVHDSPPPAILPPQRSEPWSRHSRPHHHAPPPQQYILPPPQVQGPTGPLYPHRHNEVFARHPISGDITPTLAYPTHVVQPTTRSDQVPAACSDETQAPRQDFVQPREPHTHPRGIPDQRRARRSQTQSIPRFGPSRPQPLPRQNSLSLNNVSPSQVQERPLQSTESAPPRTGISLPSFREMFPGTNGSPNNQDRRALCTGAGVSSRITGDTGTSPIILPPSTVPVAALAPGQKRAVSVDDLTRDDD